MTRVDQELIKREYAAGRSASEIARSLSCSPTTVYRVLKAAGVKGRPGGGKVVQRSAAIAEAYAQGELLEEIAARYGCSVWAVQSAAKRQGVPRRRRGGQWKDLPKEVLDQIEDRYSKGDSQQQIGRDFHLHQTIVSRILRSRGVETGYARAERNPRWKGGRYTGPDGYVLVRSGEFPEMRLSNGYVREHRLVMARHLGRPLTSREQPHHKNGIRDDNRIENLELRVLSHGPGSTEAHCETCTCFNGYEEKNEKSNRD